MLIRFAEPGDSVALLKVYSQYIETPITFEYVLPSTEEFAERIARISKEYPYLVCESRDGKVVGYAYAHRALLRAAYQWNAEMSVYLDRNFTSRGLGKRLYACLMELLKLQGIRTATSSVTAGNPKSDALHHSFGFEVSGIHRNAGYKCGGWHDIIHYARQIGPYDSSPALFIPFRDIPEQQAAGILEQFNQIYE